jgi:spermine oxidase
MHDFVTETLKNSAASKMTLLSNKTDFKVVIIGGGLAGLSAAVHLVENGVNDICLIEAKNSLGGRICTIGVEGNPLELGAQWIHGACTANSVFNLANK